jgi:hypothetical protein
LRIDQQMALAAVDLLPPIIAPGGHPPPSF